MAEIRTSLASGVATHHAVFEPDQVLTHAQLNGAVDYLDAQERLARVSLHGVGIVCGLRVSLLDNAITLTRGVGVTTDGDLVRIEESRTFTRYKPYGPGAPSYGPFMIQVPDPVEHTTSRIAAWELVADGTAGASALADFNTNETAAQTTLATTAAVLLIESVDQLDELCNGTDCDNHGGARRHDLRVVLVPAANAANFQETLITPDGLARRLPEVVAQRVAVSKFATTSALFDAITAACNATRTSFNTAVGAFLDAPERSALFDNDVVAPMRGWAARLKAVSDAFTAASVGVQHLHDLLKDLAETWNAFREFLFGQTAVCAPGVTAFAKHLLLGGLSTAAAPRTGLYPSPLAASPRDAFAHARFLLAKLDAMITAFSVKPGLTLKITPSHTEDRDLETRAIPFYYAPEAPLSVRDRWSFALAQRGASASHPGYFAAQGAPDPFASPIARYSFFRIEGLLGVQVDKAVDLLEAEITARNLPIAVLAVKLSNQRKGIFKKPRPLHTDLHRIHRVLRLDAADRIEQASAFGDALSSHVETSASQRLRSADQANKIKGDAKSKSVTIKRHADTAKASLLKPFATFTQDDTWRASTRDAMDEGVRLKGQLHDVAKAPSVTPLEGLVSMPHFNLLEFLGHAIRDKEEKAEARKLFAAFLAEHPGLEHLGGAHRGGTFVLVYDDNNAVIADFALPYFCAETEDDEEPTVAPETPPRLIRPSVGIEHFFDVVRPLAEHLDEREANINVRLDPKLAEHRKALDDGIRVQDQRIAERTTVLDQRITERSTVLDQRIAEHATQTRDLLGVTRDTIAASHEAITTAGAGSGGAAQARPSVADATQRELLTKMAQAAAKVLPLRVKLLDKPDAAALAIAQRNLRAAEGKLVVAIVAVMASAKAAVAEFDEGDDGRTLLLAAIDAAGAVRSLDAITVLRAQLTALEAGDNSRIVATFRAAIGLA